LGHNISGLVAMYEPLATAMRPPAVTAPLANGFGLAIVSLEKVIVDEEPDEPPIETMEMAAILGESFPIAFVATDYFGGEGSQGAAAWRPGGVLPYRISPNSINEALAFVGVVRRGNLDEFDTVGLGWYRSNDRWIEFARYGKAAREMEAWPAAAEAWRNRAKTTG